MLARIKMTFPWLIGLVGSWLIASSSSYDVEHDGGIQLYVQYADDLELVGLNCDEWTDGLKDLLIEASRILHSQTEKKAYLRQIDVVLPSWMNFCDDVHPYNDQMGQHYFNDIKLVRNLKPTSTFMESSECATSRFSTAYISWVKVKNFDEDFAQSVADVLAQQLVRKKILEVVKSTCNQKDSRYFYKLIGNRLGPKTNSFNQPTFNFYQWDTTESHLKLKSESLLTTIAAAEVTNGMTANVSIQYHSREHGTRPVLNARVVAHLRCNDSKVQLDLEEFQLGKYHLKPVKSLIPGGYHELRIYLEGTTLPHINVVKEVKYPCCNRLITWGDARQVHALHFADLIEAGAGSTYLFYYPSELHLISTTTTSTSTVPTTSTTSTTTQPSSAATSMRTAASTPRKQTTTTAARFDDEYEEYDETSGSSTTRSALVCVLMAVFIVLNN